MILDINILESVSHNEILCKLISLDRGKISVSGHVIIRWIRNDFSSEIKIEKYPRLIVKGSIKYVGMS